MAKMHVFINRDLCRVLVDKMTGKASNKPEDQKLLNFLDGKLRHLAAGKEITFLDSKQDGFGLRVLANGVMSFTQRYLKPGLSQAGKPLQGRLTVGGYPEMTPEQARQKVQEELRQVETKRDSFTVQQEKRAKREADAIAASTLTIRQFIANDFEKWECAHAKKTGKGRIRRLLRDFAAYLDMPLAEFNAGHAEDWITAAHLVVVTRGKRAGQVGLSNGSINRILGILSPLFTLAWRKKLIPAHPLYRAELHQGEPERVRMLGRDEIARLFAALYRREEAARAARDRGNTGRIARRYPLLPDLRAVPYTDALIPMVVWARETGEREQEMRLSTWGDVYLDAPRPYVVVRAENCKTAKGRKIYLSGEAIAVLTAWHTQSTGKFVFPNRKGTGPVGPIRKAWKAVLADAKLDDFDWRDFRHDFASQLVSRGVSLKVVGDLMGHEDPKMTQRYATVAPDHLADSVERLDSGRVISETDRLSPTLH